MKPTSDRRKARLLHGGGQGWHVQGLIVLNSFSRQQVWLTLIQRSLFLAQCFLRVFIYGLRVYRLLSHTRFVHLFGVYCLWHENGKSRSHWLVRHFGVALISLNSEDWLDIRHGLQQLVSGFVKLGGCRSFWHHELLNLLDFSVCMTLQEIWGTFIVVWNVSISRNKTLLPKHLFHSFLIDSLKHFHI